MPICAGRWRQLPDHGCPAPFPAFYGVINRAYVTTRAGGRGAVDLAMAVTIDTYAAVRELEAAGIEPAHAEAIVRTVSRADADLVTKADLRAELHATIASLERRLIGYLVATVVIVLAAIKYL